MSSTGASADASGKSPERQSELDAITSKIRKTVGQDGKAIAAVSGGVDSSVAAILVNRAIGDRLKSIFVDTGLLRANEARSVSDGLNAAGLPHTVIDASREFFDALRGITSPDEKRRRIGEAFIRVFEKEAMAWGAEYLVQGTIAPDWIESGGSLRDTIKLHHNVGGLPKDMTLKLVEPVRDLYKDEVRALARALGLKEAHRQPFPGPGLAVRVLGEVTPERVTTLRTATRIVEESIEDATKAGKMTIPWQYFAVLLPTKSIGVIGDNRTYAETLAIRAVESSDAMTATASQVPFDVLREISEKITRELSGKVNRVAYDVTDKPPATIEWE